MENKENFQYTYSAKEQEEIKRIRNNYVAPEILRLTDERMK